MEVEASKSGVDYDVIVLGGGAPGEHCAGALAEGGLRVAVVERELVGGECSYWACIPSKTLLRPGEAVHGARGAAANAQVDIEAALAWRDFMGSHYSDVGQERWLEDRGIGRARTRPRTAAVGRVPRRSAASRLIELVLGVQATNARRDGDAYVLELDNGRELRAGSAARRNGKNTHGCATSDSRLSASKIHERGIPVDAHLRAGAQLWAIGDVNGLWPLYAHG